MQLCTPATFVVSSEHCVCLCGVPGLNTPLFCVVGSLVSESLIFHVFRVDHCLAIIATLHVLVLHSIERTSVICLPVHVCSLYFRLHVVEHPHLHGILCCLRLCGLLLSSPLEIALLCGRFPCQAFPGWVVCRLRNFVPIACRLRGSNCILAASWWIELPSLLVFENISVVLLNLQLHVIVNHAAIVCLSIPIAHLHVAAASLVCPVLRSEPIQVLLHLLWVFYPTACHFLIRCFSAPLEVLVLAVQFFACSLALSSESICAASKESCVRCSIWSANDSASCAKIAAGIGH